VGFRLKQAIDWQDDGTQGSNAGRAVGSGVPHSVAGGVIDSGPRRGMPQGGPPAGLFTSNTGRKYNLTLTLSALNTLNHPNFAPPNGDLSSPCFGEYRNLGDLMGHMAAPTTYNRKLAVQLRFTF
jgi:hypothetical protein